MESKKDDESRSLLPSQHTSILTDDTKKNNESLNNESPFRVDDSKNTYSNLNILVMNKIE